mmetsp:Transcript_56716/g.182113  ORF Transcript_56716/g.182113 Transcript_56716/m.182113 type:complete len:226 (-) Transcript_56716:136-813(-)
MAAINWKTAVFVRFGSNSPSTSRLKSAGRKLLASCHPLRSTVMCTTSCKARATSTGQAKTLHVGFCLASCFAGALRDTKKKHMEVKSDSTAVCPSPSLTPSNVRTDMAKADMMLFKPIILYIIRTVDSVALPHRRMFRLHFTESPLYVKGLAMLASPRRTKGATPSTPARSGGMPCCACRLPAACATGAGVAAVSRETPTCACFRAPTSLVPSPTIMVCERWFNA